MQKKISFFEIFICFQEVTGSLILLVFFVRFCSKIALFFCLFSYLGKTFVKASCKPFDVMEELNAMAGFEPTQDLQLFEVGEKNLL